MAETKYIKDLLKMNLCILNYQRPYKWTHRNIQIYFSTLIMQSLTLKNIKILDIV